MRGYVVPPATDAPIPIASRNLMTYDAIPDLSLETSDDRHAISFGTRLHRKRAMEQSLTQQVRRVLEIGALDDCLLQALDMAVANGDAKAAEIIAAECMALVELRRGLRESGCVVEPVRTARRHDRPAQSVALKGMVQS